MALRSSGKKLSFEILGERSSLEEDQFLLLTQSSPDTLKSNSTTNDISKNQKKKKKNRNKHKKSSPHATISEDPSAGTSTAGSNSNSNSLIHSPVSGIGEFQNGAASFNEDRFRSYGGGRGGGGGTVVCTSIPLTDVVCVYDDCISKIDNNNGELRQRNVSFGGTVDVEADDEKLASVLRVDGEVAVEADVEVSSSAEKQRNVPNGCGLPRRLETVESLDWKQLMADDPTYLFSVEKSPVTYLMDEIDEGNSLRRTTTLGSEKERERVYDTIFRLPWRCELLIDVGFFVCLDSFLSLLTVMPARILMTVWKLLTRQFKKPSAAELSDFGCFIVLASGVILLEQTDISLIYHMIRGQGTIKLYVVYNVLEIFDKLCQSFGADVFQTLFNSAEGLASCTQENIRFWIWRFVADQAITLSTCIVAHNNALLALLVSNNFSEIKSSVFKRFSKENIHSLVYSDSVERFHITAFLLFVLAQNILEAEGPWFESFLYNALLVFICEMLVDIIKHSFLAKFNDIKPIAYSEFLEDLCNQTLKIQSADKDKILSFIPLAPACVVIRVVTPVYAARLPYSPLIWRIFWIFLLSCITFVMLMSLKIMIGMGLQKHASWYVNRCRKRKHHLHSD
ncbi:Protein POLLEN DEFECTIVE IN GUIDANCE 1 [Linum perenne]